MLNKDYLMNEFQEIRDIEGNSVVALGLIENIEINEDNKRVYVTLKQHKETDFFEMRIRDIVKEEGYDCEIEKEVF